MSFPLAIVFNEIVAMDLKHWDKNVLLLDLVDLATRFSASSVTTSKDKEVVLNKILLMWIGTSLGSPAKFIADNRGEVANEEYKDMAKKNFILQSQMQQEKTHGAMGSANATMQLLKIWFENNGRCT